MRWGKASWVVGLPILYISLFAAFSLYDIIPQMMAFAAMVVVTAAGMALAVLHNATALGFLALLGGFLTPLMVSTGHDARDSLSGTWRSSTWGVLGVAVFKRWRALDVLAFPRHMGSVRRPGFSSSTLPRP